MDRITESLHAFLKSAKIPYKTMFNATGGAAEGESTSTVIHIRKSDDHKQVIDIVIDVYPKDKYFIFQAYPRYVFTAKYLDKIQPIAYKWNNSGMLANLIIEEENGVTDLDCYCFQIIARGIADSRGVSKYIWSRYLKEVKSHTWLAWNKIVASIHDFEFDL